MAVSQLERVAFEALKAAEVLLATEAPGYQVLPVIRLALVEFDKIIGPELHKITTDAITKAEATGASTIGAPATAVVETAVAAAAKSPEAKAAEATVKSRVAKIEHDVEAKVEAALGAHQPAPATPADPTK